MNNLIIFLATLLTAGAVVVSQRSSLAKVRRILELRDSQATVLRARTAELEQRRADLQRLITEAHSQLSAARPEPAEPSVPAVEIVPPNAANRGGWPTGAGYFYLPKEDLNSVGYRLFESHRLTDDAAQLFGMTPGDRQAVDIAYDDIWRKFRQLEIEHLEWVETPKYPQALQDRASVSYRIPSLENEAGVLRAEFASSLQQTLGATRSGYLLERANDYLASKLDDLGQNARIISFWLPSSDGKQPACYGICNEGINSSTWAIQTPVEEDSQEAYYARLFGVSVPVKTP
jgi:hypothetical protein